MGLEKHRFKRRSSFPEAVSLHVLIIQIKETDRKKKEAHFYEAFKKK